MGNNRITKTGLFSAYFFTFMCLFLGFGGLSDYRDHGYYIDYKYEMVFSGEQALFPICGLIAGGVVFGIYSLYLTFKVINQKKEADKPNPPLKRDGETEGVSE